MGFGIYRAPGTSPLWDTEGRALRSESVPLHCFLSSQANKPIPLTSERLVHLSSSGWVWALPTVHPVEVEELRAG